MEKELFKGRYITPSHVEAYKNGVYKTLFKGIKEDIKGFVDCYEGTKVKGKLFAGGLEKSNDAKKDKDLLKKAYEMGRKIK